MRSRIPPFEQIYAEQADRIYRFCYRLCGNAADAEDLTQEVFVLAWEGLSGFQGQSSITTWLYRITLNRWHRRRRAINAFPLETDELTTSTPSVEREIMMRISLEDALMSLPDAQREAFLLVKSEGLKCREAAEALEIPLGTLLSRVHDATLRLRKSLSEEALEPSSSFPRSSSPSPEVSHEL